MKYYYAVFTIAYILSFLLFNFLIQVISIEISSAIVILIAGSFFTAWHFAEREQRCPLTQKKKLLIGINCLQISCD